MFDASSCPLCCGGGMLEGNEGGQREMMGSNPGDRMKERRATRWWLVTGTNTTFPPRGKW